MSSSLTRREFLTRAGMAVAAIETLDHLDPCCAFAADARTADKDLFELKPVADGIYAAIAAPRYKVNCNAAVILTNDGVIVVDSHSKPSAAFALYREIQSVTKMPIRKIINTHFHWDHWQGNQAYAEKFPNLEIIASERTRANLTSADAGSGGIGYVEKQLAQFKPTLPTRTVSNSVTLKEGGREIQILVLGRAHTDGDVFIYLPREKVVASGDALIDWMPFLNDGYPEEWVQTLAALEKYDFDRVIPGHGDVMPKAQMAFFRGYLTDLIGAVKNAAANGAGLEEMKKEIANRLAPKYEQGMSKHPLGQYRDRVALNIEMVHRKVVKKS